MNRWDIMCFHRTCCWLLLEFLQGSKGGPMESIRHNVLPQNMLLVFFCSSRAAPLNRWDILQGLDISGRTSPESSGTHPLRDAYGTNHSNPCQFKPTPVHANPFETALIHVIYCPSMPIVPIYPKLRQSTEGDANPRESIQSAPVNSNR